MNRIYRVTVLAREDDTKRDLSAAIVVRAGGLDTPEVAVARLSERLLEETARRGLEFLGFVTTSQPYVEDREDWG